MSEVRNEKDLWIYDKDTSARFDREREQTLRGLVSLKTRQGKISQSKYKEHRENGKIVEEETGEVMMDPIKIHGSKCNKSSLKLNTSRLRWHNEKIGERLQENNKRKFIASLLELKTKFLNQKWDYYCHLKERTLEADKIRQRNISRIKWESNIATDLSPQLSAFDKIIKYKREKKKQEIARKERMMNIIEKIAREVNGDFRKKIRIVHRKREEPKRLSKISLNGTNSEENEPSQVKHNSENTETEIQKDEIIEFTKNENVELRNELMENERSVQNKEEDTSTKAGRNLDELVTKNLSESQIVRPKDASFFASPSLVSFDDFKVGKVYSRRVALANKSGKWAYLRYHRIETDIWEHGVIEIDPIDAARVRPGLHVTINVKFTPIHNENITADISFLTLNPECVNIFHEFRLPVRCTPESPLPILDPKEIRFPTAPIWKFRESTIRDKVLIISNDGGKSFSFILGKKDQRRNYFVWEFEEADATTAKTSIENINFSTGTDVIYTDVEETVLQEKYQIEVPAKFKCRLKITFHPRYVGLHHEVLEILFVADEQIFDKQVVPLWAEATGSQIHLDPPCVDLGIVIIDSEVCQQSFNVINTDRTSVEILTKTPRRLTSQVTVHPKSMTIRPETSGTVSVRFMPGPNVTDISKGYYNCESGVLEFPVHVHVLSQEGESVPPLILKVLATLTTCHALVLEPAEVDLGRVHTHESVLTELTLTNESLVVQEFGFLDLPPFVEIQPNYGFGKILPGQTVPLHLIYSGCLTDIPGNEIGKNGLAGGRSFRVRAVTLAELAGNERQLDIAETTNPYDEELKTSGFYGVPPSSPVNFTNATNQSEERNIATAFNSNSPSEEQENPGSLNKIFNRRKQKNIIHVLVYIVDAFCEFNEQIIEFPATPCDSFSRVSVDLRGSNMASYPRCTCGALKKRAKEFTARYEFKCSSHRVKVTPQNGLLRSNDLVKVNFVFMPETPKNSSPDEFRKPKSKTDFQNRGASDKYIGLKGPRKGSKEFYHFDETANEVSPLETLEPFVSTIFVACVLNVELADGTKRDETLFAKLICPVIRPDIVILNEDREISFGRTAIGTVPRRLVFVKNISSRNVKVHVTLLDPFGPFAVSPGKLIEPGTILTLPVTYRPTEDHQKHLEEQFEIRSGHSKTGWLMKVSGCGVIPSWIISPEFRVARLEATAGKPVELKVTIRNTGPCTLIFQLRLLDVLEGNITPAEETKRQDGDSRKAKSLRKEKFGDSLYEEEETAICGDTLKPAEDRGFFSFRNFDEDMRVVVAEDAKLEFAIRFQPPRETLSTENDEVTTKKGLKGSKKKTVSLNVDKSNYRWVGLFKLTLGNSKLVQDIILICSSK